MRDPLLWLLDFIWDQDQPAVARQSFFVRPTKLGSRLCILTEGTASGGRIFFEHTNG